jgi:methanethiol S-methyltransferase
MLFHSVFIKYLSVLFLIAPGFWLGIVSLAGYASLFRGISSLFIAAQPISLQKNGIHKFVRHPLYLATLLLIWGYFLFDPQLHILLSVILLTGYLFIGIQFEERKLIAFYGESYTKYEQEVPALFPKLLRKK